MDFHVKVQADFGQIPVGFEAPHPHFAACYAVKVSPAQAQLLNWLVVPPQGVQAGAGLEIPHLYPQLGESCLDVVFAIRLELSDYMFLGHSLLPQPFTCPSLFLLCICSILNQMQSLVSESGF